MRKPNSIQQGGNIKSTNNKPPNTLRCVNIRVTIWQNASEKGPFFAKTFSRPFKNQSGKWRNGISFGLNDLDALFTVARGQGVDGHSRLQTLRFVDGKHPAFGSFPSTHLLFYLFAKCQNPSIAWYSFSG